MKYCPKCNQDKDLSEFNNSSNSKDGLNRTCKSCVKIQNNKHYENNKTDKIKYASEYRNKNLKKVQNRLNNYYKNRRKTDIQFRLKENIRVRIYNSLKVYLDKKIKYKTSSYLIGCNIDDYKKHIESQFDLNMNWDNYGSYWEIDHIIPIDSFDLTKVENQEKCFNYTNTRPLKVLENQQKSNKI